MSTKKEQIRKVYNVVVKEWFDKTYGNTYFSATIENSKGDLIGTRKLQYGYGSHAEHQVFKWLKRNTRTKSVQRANRLEQCAHVTIHDNCLKREVKAHGEAV